MPTFDIDDIVVVQPDRQPGDRQPGDRQPGDRQPGDGQPGDGQPGDRQPGDGQPGDGQPGIDQNNIKGKSFKDIEDELDRIDREIENRMGNSKDLTPSELDKKLNQKPEISKPGQGGDGSYRSTIEKPKPVYSWKEIIRQFVVSKKGVDTTRSKPSKKAMTAMSGAAVTGAGAMPPGERPLEEAFKLVLVLDTSGSMMGAIGTALAETEQLIKTNYSNVNGNFGVCFFSSSADYFAVNPGQRTFHQISNLNELTTSKTSMTKRPMKDLFNMAKSGGTRVSESMVDQLTAAAAKGYNIIMISDTDLLYGSNWDNFKKLYAGAKRNLFFIADSAYSYEEIIKKMKIKPTTFSHF